MAVPAPESPRRDPAWECAARVALHGHEAARLDRRHAALANGRLAVFGCFLLLLWPTVLRDQWSLAWLLLPVAAFATLAVVHDGVLRRRGRAEQAADYWRAALARAEDRWTGDGPTGLDFLEPGHAYAADLDLFGRGSLFALLCRARTAPGRRALAAWLLVPAPAAAVRERQEAARELAGAPDLREALAVTAGETPAALAPERLLRWCRGEPPAPAAVSGLLASALTAAVVAAGVGGLALGWGARPALYALLLVGVYRLGPGRGWRAPADAAEEAASGLAGLTGLLRLLETAPVEAPALRSLQARVATTGTPASARIRRLRLIADCLEARRHLLFAPLAWLLLWDVHFARLAARWRKTDGASVADWLDAAGEFEALASLGAHAHEHPDDAWPEIACCAPLFEGEALGHPLLPRARCVRNDVRLDGRPGLLLVTGSNMSGKSTLLRTVGTLAVLAQAGAPVPAARLRISPLVVAASLRVQDSLRDGVSRFGAELARLRLLLELAREGRPLLFLVDELMLGTNPHDRQAGAAGLVRTLLGHGAIGLITTHDPALAVLAASLAPKAANGHFADRIEDGEMAFDYRLRPGPVARGNALALLRALGLDV